MTQMKKIQEGLVQKLAPEVLEQNTLTTQLGKKFGQKLISKDLLGKTLSKQTIRQ